jgi:hypothetical protein
MSLSDLASLGSFVSGIAVLASLIFLYFQVRQVKQQVIQTEKNQQATIRQQRASRTVAINLGATEPSLVESAYKAVTGAKDFSPTQLYQFTRYSHALFKSYEDSFYQHRDGLLTDRDFGADINIAGRVLRVPAFRLQWRRMRTGYGPEFVEFIDALLAKTPVEPPSFDTDAWLAEWSMEQALVPSGPSH